MHSSERDTLAAECRTFSAYLIQQEPGAYVVDKYCEAHAAGNILHSPERSALDALLLRLATRNHFFTRLIDLYTALFFKPALVRKKLVLLLAILESAPATHTYFGSTDSRGQLQFCLMALQRGLACGAVLLLSLVAILPLHLGLRGRDVEGLRGPRGNGRRAPGA